MRRGLGASQPAARRYTMSWRKRTVACGGGAAGAAAVVVLLLSLPGEAVAFERWWIYGDMPESLHYAAATGDVPLTRKRLKAGDDPNATAGWRSTCTPLHEAAISGSLPVGTRVPQARFSITYPAAAMCCTCTATSSMLSMVQNILSGLRTQTMAACGRRVASAGAGPADNTSSGQPGYRLPDRP